MTLVLKIPIFSYRFKVAKEHNPSESARPRSSGGTRERAIEAGLTITSFDFSSKDPSIFIVGTLCGGVYKCSVDQAVSVEGKLLLNFHTPFSLRSEYKFLYIFSFGKMSNMGY